MTNDGSILVILPSLNRHTALKQSMACLYDLAEGYFDLLILDGKCDLLEKVNSMSVELIKKYEIIGLMADDCFMRTPGWDNMIRTQLSGKVGMVYGRDGIQDEKIPTHPFWSSNITKALGFVFPPKLMHYYGDNFFYELAEGAGCRFYVPELFTEHLHWSTRQSTRDDTYIVAEQWYAKDGDEWAKYRMHGLKRDIAIVKSLKQL